MSRRASDSPLADGIMLALLLVVVADSFDLVCEWVSFLGVVVPPASRRPFRFIAPMPKLNQPVARWHDALRRIEDIGFSTVSVSDHFTHGWVMDPTIAMAAAAEVTSRLRVLSLVLCNDYRHPVIVHKAMATLDVLSKGRVEVGIGAGWLLDDYRAAHFPYASAAVRIERLEESLEVLKGLFAPAPLTFTGRHYAITGLEGLPKPVQRPHPPLLVGGGRRRILSLAGRNADIVGINPGLQAGVVAPAAILDMTADRVAQKVGWVRSAAAAADRSPADIEFQMSMLMTRIPSTGNQTRGAVSSLAAKADLDPAVVEQSPAVLVGSIEQCIERLLENRERFGISYLNLGGDIEAVSPIVQRLAGT